MSTPRLTAADVARLRGKVGLTQEKFAEVLSVSVSTVNRWEQGRATPSRLATNAMATLAHVVPGAWPNGRGT